MEEELGAGSEAFSGVVQVVVSERAVPQPFLEA